ncbi:LapA family protein [Brachybacterium nesterenkovii]|uniref:POSSIBLE CONSERVED MEMBRANE PROTEIN n=1 Tax=Brachybacterium nesterenkovii TaxID=47847 RepID=A0A1X6X1B0_9MICO|nr:lipopolysaccharide assembly protein LapA domain-containing protein [Brachybacterium nesterenkovii]SLM92211.1 POSSIBLE CONSERVED MEMBRANE PROTEIN [Brachybacterium nesterenkovii]
MTEFDDRQAPVSDAPADPAHDAGRDARAQRDRELSQQLPDDAKKGGSRTAGIWIALILGAIVLVLLLIFVIQNSASTQFEYFGATFQLPLGVAMLLAAIAGALVMALVGTVRIIQMSWEMRRLRKNQKAFRNLVQGD